MTLDVALVLGVLLVTIVLFVTEALRTDIVALLVMVALPWLGLIEPANAFRGFSSAAVVSIMAVIILSHGLDRTGVTRKLALPLAQLGGESPPRLLGSLLAAAGLFSSFMQNVGAAALFLPVATRLGKSGVLRVSQLMMPLGFAAILGGTLTLVGSSPLILLNDLVTAQGEQPFGLFDVTPIGLALLGAGLLYLVFFGLRMLPTRPADRDAAATSEDVLGSWTLVNHIEEAMVEEGSSLVGVLRREARLIDRFGVHVVAVRQLGRTTYAPSTTTRFAAGQRLALLGKPADIQRLAAEVGLRLRPRPAGKAALVRPESTLYAEILIPPRSPAIGKSMHDIRLRRNHGVEPLALLSSGKSHLRKFADRPLHAGDIILLHGRWKQIRALRSEPSFVLLSHPVGAAIDPTKGGRALLCFVAAVALALVGVSLPVALLSGALAMVLLRVMSIDDAYRAISWRAVFLLAGLIPLGLAMESTGAAAYLAGKLFQLVNQAPALVVLLAVGALTTLFTLFLSNVATTVVLVPLAMELGRLSDLDPRALALLVAVCAQNSFILPTHQVNALLMAPGGYRSADYLRVGGVMTALFLVIAVGGVYWLWI